MGAPEDYRLFLTRRIAAQLDREPEELERPELGANAIADAVAMALGRFANDRGELKVAQPGPSISPSV